MLGLKHFSLDKPRKPLAVAAARKCLVLFYMYKVIKNKMPNTKIAKSMGPGP